MSTKAERMEAARKAHDSRVKKATRRYERQIETLNATIRRRQRIIEEQYQTEYHAAGAEFRKALAEIEDR